MNNNNKGKEFMAKPIGYLGDFIVLKELREQDKIKDYLAINKKDQQYYVLKVAEIRINDDGDEISYDD